MSSVTDVVLCMSVCEDTQCLAGRDVPTMLIQINAWLNERQEFWCLTDVTEATRCGRHPQMHICGAGFNYFPEDDFAAFVMALPWQNPENVVLVMQPEDGATKVFRPDA